MEKKTIALMIDDEIKNNFQLKIKQNNDTMSRVLKNFIRDYIKGKKFKIKNSKLENIYKNTFKSIKEKYINEGINSKFIKYNDFLSSLLIVNMNRQNEFNKYFKNFIQKNINENENKKIS